MVLQRICYLDEEGREIHFAVVVSSGKGVVQEAPRTATRKSVTATARDIRDLSAGLAGLLSRVIGGGLTSALSLALRQSRVRERQRQRISTDFIRIRQNISLGLCRGSP